MLNRGPVWDPVPRVPVVYFGVKGSLWWCQSGMAGVCVLFFMWEGWKYLLWLPTKRLISDPILIDKLNMSYSCMIGLHILTNTLYSSVSPKYQDLSTVFILCSFQFLDKKRQFVTAS